MAKKKILLVEDDEMISSMYKTKLEGDGYEVITASNGGDGLKLALKADMDLIMLDVIVPQLDGFSILTELKKTDKTKDIPTVMLTNLGTDEDKAKGKALGAIDYLIKSNLTPSQISEKIPGYLK